MSESKASGLLRAVWEEEICVQTLIVHSYRQTLRCHTHTHAHRHTDILTVIRDATCILMSDDKKILFERYKVQILIKHLQSEIVLTQSPTNSSSLGSLFALGYQSPNTLNWDILPTFEREPVNRATNPPTP